MHRLLEIISLYLYLDAPYVRGNIILPVSTVDTPFFRDDITLPVQK